MVMIFEFEAPGGNELRKKWFSIRVKITGKNELLGNYINARRKSCQ